MRRKPSKDAKMMSDAESGSRSTGPFTGASAFVRPLDIALGVILFGSIWGMVEIVLGGAIKQAGVPHRVAIVTGLGMGIMGIGFGAFRRPYMLPLIAVVAVCVKQLMVPILHLPFFCKANSCLALLIEGGALAGMLAVAGSCLGGRGSSPGGGPELCAGASG